MGLIKQYRKNMKNNFKLYFERKKTKTRINKKRNYPGTSNGIR